MNVKKISLLFLLAIAIASFFIFDLGQYFSFDSLKQNQARLQEIVSQNYALAWLGFFALYVVMAALSVPGAAVMTLAAGALFGLASGTVLASFASSIGATLAFLASRFLLKDSVQQKFGDRLQTLNQGLEKDGAFYLFSMRLIPVFPFFLINLLFGLTNIKARTFYWVSQLGMLAGTAVYVNAGTQLAAIDSLAGIASPALLGSFALLGLFPLLAKKSLSFLHARKVYAPYTKPKQFDNNLIVIGAGSGGLVSAYIAAAVKAKVTLIEKHEMGGDCLNTGCVPSKAIIKTSKAVHHMRHAEKLALNNHQPEVDFAQVMQRVHNVVAEVAPHDSIERYTELGVNVIQGEAKIISPYEVEVNGERLSTKNIIIATGGSPFVPPIPGLDQVDYLTSDNLWGLKSLPKKLAVLGGGPIGCELSQAFARLGSHVTQIEMFERIMPRNDAEVSEFVMARFAEEGIDVRTQTQAKEVVVENGEKFLLCEHDGKTERIAFDEILVAVGRKANVSNVGIEDLGIELSERNTVVADPFMATNFPNIFVVGDATGPYQFTHTAAHQAWYASVNALFGAIKKFKADYRVIPMVTFTDPEVAQVGLDEASAKAQNTAYEVSHYGLDDLDRAITESAAYGWVKVLTVPGKDKILGVTIVGEYAGEMLAEFTLAMKHNLGLNKILGTIHPYPTWAEGNKYVAGNWKRSQTSPKVLAWLKKFHRWRRG